jgi:SAM-dependent methyltransferase
MNDAEFTAIINSKNDESWQRYHDAWSDIVDRYNVTAALVRGPSVIDIGCGECLLAKLLRETRPDVKRYVGIDASDEMIRRARAVFADSIVTVQGYAEDLHFNFGVFDTVVLGQVLEHVKDPLGVTMEAVRVLKGGGRLIVNVPADERKPHGNHLRVYHSQAEMMIPFGLAINAWGERL